MIVIAMVTLYQEIQFKNAPPLKPTEVTHYNTCNKILIWDHDGLFTVALHLLHSSHCAVQLSGWRTFEPHLPQNATLLPSVWKSVASSGQSETCSSNTNMMNMYYASVFA